MVRTSQALKDCQKQVSFPVPRARSEFAEYRKVFYIISQFGKLYLFCKKNDEGDFEKDAQGILGGASGL